VIKNETIHDWRPKKVFGFVVKQSNYVPKVKDAMIREVIKKGEFYNVFCWSRGLCIVELRVSILQASELFALL